jgi:hypothetical protein
VTVASYAVPAVVLIVSPWVSQYDSVSESAVSTTLSSSESAVSAAVTASS